MTTNSGKVSPAQFNAEESSKFTPSSKYVVDGFEVPANNNRDKLVVGDANLYSESKHDGGKLLASPEDKRKSHQHYSGNRGNSTFREVSNLNNGAASSSSSTVAAASSTEKADKNAFQKRNDYDPYWTLSYSSNNQQNNHPFLIESRQPEQQPKSYIRHRPQSEPSGLLIATNVNPYLNNQQNNNQPDSYYVYDSSPPESSPYRSRYQHRYHQNQHNQETRRPESSSVNFGSLAEAFSNQAQSPPRQSNMNDAPSLLMGSLRTQTGLLSDHSVKPSEFGIYYR